MSQDCCSDKHCLLSRESLKPYPALFPLYYLMGGIFTVTWAGIYGGSQLGSIGLACGWCIVGWLLFSANWSGPCWFLSGILLTLLNITPWLNSYQRSLAGPEGYAEIEGTVVDTMLTGADDLQWLEPAGKVAFSISRIRLSAQQPWRKCSGTILICDKESRYVYGQHMRFTGALRSPFKSRVPHLFNQERYLRYKGIVHCFYPTSREHIGKIRGWRHVPNACMTLRTTMLRALLKGIPEDEPKALLAAVVFGMKSGLTWTQKRQFTASGMIHLFAVSGLHVGIIFSLIMALLALARVPFRWRYAVAPIILLLYVFLTGAGSSAVRAWVMLSVWSVGRSLRLPAKPLNTVLVAALLLLIINPLNLFQAGFQYSFLLVLAILSCWRLVSMIWSCVGLPLKLVPGRAHGRRRWAYNARRACLLTAGTMAVFWLGGLGLTVWYGKMILPVSFLSNMFVGVIAWGIMALGWLKIMCETVVIPFIPWVLGNCLQWLVGLLVWLSEVASDPSLVLMVGPVPVWLIIIYYIMFAWLACSPPEITPLSRRIVLLIIPIGMLLGWNSTGPSGVHVDILQPDSSALPVICMRDGYRVVVINTGPRAFGYTVTSWCRGEGIDTIDEVVLMEGRNAFAGSLTSLLDSSNVRAVVQLDGRSIETKVKPYGVNYRQLKSLGVGNPTAEVRELGDGRKRYTVTTRFVDGQTVNVSLTTTKYSGSILLVNDRQYQLNYRSDSVLMTSFILR